MDPKRTIYGPPKKKLICQETAPHTAMKFCMELEEINPLDPMESIEKFNLWRKCTSYRQILHGAIRKQFWVTNDVQEINVVIYLFILFSVPKGCLSKIVHFPPLWLNLIKIIGLKVEMSVFFTTFATILKIFKDP